jgi:hypothetical protein
MTVDPLPDWPAHEEYVTDVSINNQPIMNSVCRTQL